MQLDFYTFPPLAERHAEAVTGERRPYSPTWLEDWLGERIQETIGRPSRALDLRRDDLSVPPGSYDVVWTDRILCRAPDLATMIDKIRTALRPGGMLVGREYVGPKRMSLSARQREAVLAAQMVLPERLQGPLPEQIGGADVVSSDEVVPQIRRAFTFVQVRPFDGSILQYALPHSFYAGFEAERDGPILAALQKIERALIASGDLKPDNAVIIARKPILAAP